MRILDRYLLRTFMMPWLSCLLGFTFLFVIIDLVDRLDTFLENNVPALQIAFYYLNFVPTIWIYIAPITLLLGLLYALYQLTRSNEIIAMRASGVSLYRVLSPFIVLGILISLSSLYVSTSVAPKSEGWTDQFIERLKNPESQELHDLRFRDPGSNRSWVIDRLDLDTHDVMDVTVMQRRPGEDTLEFVLAAERAVWMDSYWFFHNGTFQSYSVDGYKKGPPQDFNVRPMMKLDESPDRIIRETMNFDYMSSKEMKDYLANRSSVSEKTRANLETQIQLRLAQPWLCLVTMLMAVPFGTQTARKGVFVGISLCLVLFFTLFFMMSLFKALGLGMMIPPFWAGWTPTILFGIIGMWLLRKLR